MSLERQKVVTPNSELLGVVEGMAHRLLGEEEVAAVMKMCHLVRGFALHLQTETFSLSRCRLHRDALVYSMWQKARWRT